MFRLSSTWGIKFLNANSVKATTSLVHLLRDLTLSWELERMQDIISSVDESWRKSLSLSPNLDGTCSYSTLITRILIWLRESLPIIMGFWFKFSPSKLTSVLEINLVIKCAYNSYGGLLLLNSIMWHITLFGKLVGMF